MGRIAEVLDEEPFIANPVGDLATAAPADGGIEFSDVSFTYRADAVEDVLEHIDLRIERGSTVGILGGPGSGKSSLVQLIARLYDATEGAVLVDVYKRQAQGSRAAPDGRGGDRHRRRCAQHR